MRPLFTVHAGEYLVGIRLQELGLNAWIPAKDSGIDLLVTDPENRRTTSLQVKYGKDFLPGKPAVWRNSMRCHSWFVLDRAKLDASRADFWVFVLHGFKADKPDFVIIPKAELRRRMVDIHGSDIARLQSYLCSTENKKCWETRGLQNSAMVQIANGTYEDPVREFTEYLNENGWAAITKKLFVASG
jgi:hypothetical protein